jgi:superfamily II DNA or RNA helicase
VLAAPVTVVGVTWHGTNALTLIYRGDGGIGEAVLYRDHEAGLTIEAPSSAYSFDADPELFRVAAEALRIRMAGRYDQMLAVQSSAVEPLPHQIKAVYGELLPRTPLRFLLADDPGAGKTIMAGLYIKELSLRGDLARCLVVAPGSLVEQWQEELLDKFGLRFTLLTRSLAHDTLERSVFEAHSLLIARMDQLSRNEDLQQQLAEADFDLVVVDEAHRMSAHYYGAEIKTTRRYDLGKLLGQVARHLLLMSATPHAGNEADFQLFMALLDADRFEGKFRDGVHAVDTQGLMRRMVKEDLLTFEGKPLFPERRADTLAYELSPGEQDLYDAVTDYVREQMNRAEQLRAAGEGRRGNTVGFALTVLQRRLASSPEAILRSLERRKRRLEGNRQQLLQPTSTSPLEQRLAQLLGRPPAVTEDDLDDMTGSEREEAEEQVVDAATAAQTLAELDKEIAVLGDLVELATRVRHSGTDRKWTELRGLLLDEQAMYDDHGNRRKIIIFSEHRDTLEYLVTQVRALLGKDEAVVSIHGGVGREQRRAAQELFTQDKDVVVLVATDAAGEGLNLQRAHLMVNYDLPWNPNRIEQRFGRIHRIGQTEVCRLWNLVAKDTREGQVFQRLLAKVEEQRRAYNGKIFDILGEAFEERPLRELLIEAIRYGDQPEVRARLHQVIDAEVSAGLDKLVRERALYRDSLADADVQELRRRMDAVRARRLQPHYVQALFAEAFARLGGRMSRREQGRYEITHVPGDVVSRDRQVGTGAPVLRRYERVCYDRHLTRIDGSPRADLLAPGHPLLDAVVDVAVERWSTTLKSGALLIDRADSGTEPRLLVAVTQSVTNSSSPPRTVAKRFDYVELSRDGSARHAGPAPYLDYAAPSADETQLIASMTRENWLAQGLEALAVSWAVEHGTADYLAEVRERITAAVDRTRAQVKQRLTQEINHADIRAAELRDQEQSGRELRQKPEVMERRARDLERRLTQRLAVLDAESTLRATPPGVAGGALVIPQGALDRLRGIPTDPQRARETEEVDRRAIAAVVSAERALGREPEVMPHNNPGFDIRSLNEDGHLVFLEVKGRIAGSEDFTVTRNEVLFGKNADRYRLALVRVSPNGPDYDELRYVQQPFKDFEFGDFAADAVRGDWNAMWERGGSPS